jgi:hypothetical protein
MSRDKREGILDDPSGNGAFIIIQGRAFLAWPWVGAARGRRPRKLAARRRLKWFVSRYEAGEALAVSAREMGVSEVLLKKISRALGLWRGKGWNSRLLSDRRKAAARGDVDGAHGGRAV